MKVIENYKKRFYSLLESKTGDVKPLISEAGPLDQSGDQLNNMSPYTKGQTLTGMSSDNKTVYTMTVDGITGNTSLQANITKVGVRILTINQDGSLTGDNQLGTITKVGTYTAPAAQSSTASTASTASTTTQVTKTPYTRTEIIKMQDALKALKIVGVDPGTSDGKIGPKTAGAIDKLIEKYNELKAKGGQSQNTGEINKNTDELPVKGQNETPTGNSSSGVLPQGDTESSELPK